MSLVIDVHNIEKGLHELFKHAFITNCNLDDENVTPEESATLEELDPAEVLDNFKDLILLLLKFKKEYKSSDKSELAQRSEQFETLLQKLEAEVRSHIRVEHQLKLHIENNLHRIEELEKTGANDKTLIKELEEKCNTKKISKSSELDKLRKETDEKVRSLLEIIEKKDKTVHKFEYENVKLRTLLEEKARECEIIKKELLKYNKITPKSKENHSTTTADLLKKKFELTKNQNIKDKSPSIREYSKRDRRSAGENDLQKILTSAYVKRDNSASMKKDDSKSFGKSYGRGHMRSISDHKLICSKKTSFL
ncbi:hypothetical protein SteCoe_8755 [Stentor coeruleus]|uniref:Uncharacterized protein n=1 Tax=Stentor coeruleus TaxID=5963 RepID=A0A1R2CJC4_9CILI|nr:hypothetical protein SteCoe_8755 [Stentor coeruleus]